MSLKLFQVEVVVETVVLAEDADEAIKTAESCFGDVVHGGTGCCPVEISSLQQLPELWANTAPFYQGVEEVEELDLTCREIVERFQKRQEEEAEELVRKAQQERFQLKLFPTG